ncbi:Detected protein of unknown function [Hibiscus syriacus]|uniref:Uncharacterized protein n=1 Tax=Hibiscus syriacus TaxID=106335 RepID=A0A6A2YI88_HIBSY|nr:Detected protein of unknown function [Hibiscus syriacus]
MVCLSRVLAVSCTVKPLPPPLSRRFVHTKRKLNSRWRSMATDPYSSFSAPSVDSDSTADKVASGFCIIEWPESDAELADTYDFLKLGGSDYHGRGGNGESELGSVILPVLVLHEFLKVAQPIWCGAIKDILESYAKEPSALNLARIARFSRMDSLKGTSPLSCGKDWIDRCLSSW